VIPTVGVSRLEKRGRMRSVRRPSSFDPRDTKLRVWPIEDGSVCVRAIAGDVDLSSVGGLRRRLLWGIPVESFGLVLDLTGVSFLDSTGLRLLFELRTALAAGHQRLALVLGDDSPLWRLFNVTQLPTIIPVARSLDEAKAAVKRH
jgi:anti-anti-sigma factor